MVSVLHSGVLIQFHTVAAAGTAHAPMTICAAAWKSPYAKDEDAERHN